MTQRLDVQVSSLFGLTRSQAKDMIQMGRVLVNGMVCTKPSRGVGADDVLVVDHRRASYVSRAAEKLQYALDVFSVEVAGKRALDIGASTGGFTQVLLSRDVQEVYAVDVGKGQMHPSLARDTRVHLYEACDIRDFIQNGYIFDIVTCDVSFISIVHLLDVFACSCKVGGDLIILIKPQFEVGRQGLTKRGVVKNPEVVDTVLSERLRQIQGYGLTLKACIASPVLGKEGNREYIAHFVQRGRIHDI